MIKPVPTAGARYQVKRGDRLDNIEKIAYGYVTGTIEAANPMLTGRSISLEKRPTIYPGDILSIPLMRSSVVQEIEGKREDEITLIIAGREIVTTSKRILRTMDTPSDGWTASIDWQPGLDSELDQLLTPYTYPDAQVYIGGKLKINGFLFIVNPSQSESGLTVNIQGFSATKNAIDSTMPAPFEEEEVSLRERSESVLAPFGIQVEFDTEEDTEKFDRVTAEKTHHAGRHLVELARQRGFLSSSTNEGNWLYTKYKPSSPMDTISSGDHLPVGWAANFDGTKVFSKITGIAESPGEPTNNFSIEDSELPKTRFTAFKADEANAGNLEKAVNWKRTKQYADALTIPFPVNSIFTSKGELWEEGRTVTIISPEIFCPNGFTFLIRSVEYIEEDDGTTAVLNIVPPSVFSGGDIELPWRV